MPMVTVDPRPRRNKQNQRPPTVHPPRPAKAAKVPVRVARQQLPPDFPETPCSCFQAFPAVLFGRFFIFIVGCGCAL